ECLERLAIRLPQPPARYAVIDKTLQRARSVMERRRTHPIGGEILCPWLMCRTVLIIEIIVQVVFPGSVDRGQVEPLDRAQGQQPQALAALAADLVRLARIVVANHLGDSALAAGLAGRAVPHWNYRAV